MIKKEMKLVVTFYTTTEAMKMEQTCKENETVGRLIPVPRTISAGCGLAWCAGTDQEENLRELMEKHAIQPQGIYQCLV